ncbi:hypothetical protein [Pseudoalteromonas rubra]|uniref:hypothetical protein n=1 Tax=Pseudoalteromonas rubra TaxID=43658 RepID=UPI002DC06064|nr:hypothetical protein [Pseudoalteromonas rubra]MEC4089583.1 hypothetical protein [Pseudoalteromonas rubra]
MSCTSWVTLYHDYSLAKSVTDDEQGVMRALHDILPGKIYVNRNLAREVFEVTDYRLAITQLSPTEMIKPVKFYDCKYDEKYLHVVVPGFPDPTIINLQAIDQSFIAEQTNYNLDDMLAELKFYGQFPSSATLSTSPALATTWKTCLPKAYATNTLMVALIPGIPSR